MIYDWFERGRIVGWERGCHLVVFEMQIFRSSCRLALRAQAASTTRFQTARVVRYASGERWHSSRSLRGAGNGNEGWRKAPFSVGVVTFVTICTALGVFQRQTVHAEDYSNTATRNTSKVTNATEHLIRLEEVREHGRDADSVWIIHKDCVYDITDWIPNHPGGEVILRAAGGSIDQYWKIFSIHEKQDVYDILDQYKIGRLDPRDISGEGVAADEVDDPFATDPDRDSRLIQHSSRPCNAETPKAVLNDFITPDRLFYVRNHLWVPECSKSSAYTITVERFDGEEKTYTMDELRKKFKEHTITATLQCSGNRRSHMSTNAKQANGIPWDVGAIGNAEWTGVYLRDVLADVGYSSETIPEEVKHVQFAGEEAYGASIPISKAMDRYGDVLLAYGMNGQQLPRDHGYPLRVIVPGHVAARSVKWLKRISLADEESTSQWQRRDYKCFGPNISSDPDWSSAPSIQELPVQSAITSLKHNKTSKQNKHGAGARVSNSDTDDESLVLEGYAFSGGGREIVRVDVSMDDGKSWRQAELLDDKRKGSKAWSWKRWRFTASKGSAGKVFVVKAVDEAYNTQPDTYAPTYNLRGNLTSAWQRLENKERED